MASTDAPKPPPASSETAKDRHLRDRLPPEIRERFDAARKKALEDPKIKELRAAAEASNKEFFKAIRRKMIEIDPGLAEFAKEERKDKTAKSAGSEKKSGMNDLSEGERQRLQAARTVAQNDPAVLEAKSKLDAASTPEERLSAGKAFREAMHQAILNADSSLAPVLEKLGPKGSDKPQGPSN